MLMCDSLSSSQEFCCNQKNKTTTTTKLRSNAKMGYNNTLRRGTLCEEQKALARSRANNLRQQMHEATIYDLFPEALHNTSNCYQSCPINSYQSAAFQQQHYLTIEELKSTRVSCWLCGCNWQEDHVSLDCPECDGYALTRPCPDCGGKCKQIWTRNISTTHDRHRASWVGKCSIKTAAIAKETTPPTTTTTAQNGTSTQHNTTTTLASAQQQHPTVDYKRQPTKQVLVPPSSSSCCSSLPSSATSSEDEELDEPMSVKRASSVHST